MPARKTGGRNLNYSMPKVWCQDARPPGDRSRPAGTLTGLIFYTGYCILVVLSNTY